MICGPAGTFFPKKVSGLPIDLRSPARLASSAHTLTGSVHEARTRVVDVPRMHTLFVAAYARCCCAEQMRSICASAWMQSLASQQTATGRTPAGTPSIQARADALSVRRSDGVAQGAVQAPATVWWLQIRTSMSASAMRQRPQLAKHGRGTHRGGITGRQEMRRCPGGEPVSGVALRATAIGLVRSIGL